MTYRRSAALGAIPLLATLLVAVPGCSRKHGGEAAFERRPSSRGTSGSGVDFASLPFEAALSKAKSGKTLVMVDVYTDWCGWCKKLDKDVFADSRVASALKDVVPIRVNAERGGEAVVRRYSVQGFPTILFVDGDGNVVKRVDGYVPVERMLEMIAALPRSTA